MSILLTLRKIRRGTISNASLFRSRSYWLFIPFILVFCIILTLVLRQSAKASSQVHYLPDGNSATIQSYINDYAQNGDTLIIPSGTYNISSSVNITKSVTIKGQGVSSTTLRDANNGDGFKINANNVRIEDIKFQQVAYSGQIGIKIYNVLDFVIRNCEFRDYNGRGIETKGNATRGVVSGCSFYSSADATAIVIFGVDNPIGETPRADSNWVACPRVIEDNEVIVNEIDFGSADWVFIEDCYFEGWRHAISSNQGSKYVFRYNECYNASQPPIDVHGLESGHPRGSRAYEIYCNYIHDSSNKWAGIHIRGGDGVIWGNTILNRTHGVMLQNTIYNPGTQFTYIADDQTLKLYIWDNEKAGGAAATVTVRGTYEHLLVEDRDFFLYPMPGYEPYPYPHPLLEGTLPTPTPTPTPTSSSTPSPTPSALINDLDVKDVNNKNKWSVQENLQQGDVQYGDRSYVITSLPSYFAGCDWIRTANTSRSYTQSPLVTFTVGADAIVYIAHQDDITTKPSWMNNWVDTGYDLVNDEPTPKTYSIFAKSFGAGQTVSLGPNGDTNCGMYTVIVKEQP